MWVVRKLVRGELMYFGYDGNTMSLQNARKFMFVESAHKYRGQANRMGSGEWFVVPLAQAKKDAALADQHQSKLYNSGNGMEEN